MSNACTLLDVTNILTYVSVLMQARFDTYAVTPEDRDSFGGPWNRDYGGPSEGFIRTSFILPLPTLAVCGFLIFSPEVTAYSTDSSYHSVIHEHVGPTILYKPPLGLFPNPYLRPIMIKFSITLTCHFQTIISGAVISDWKYLVLDTDGCLQLLTLYVKDITMYQREKK